MGKCERCGMEWEAAFPMDKPFKDDPRIGMCPWCSILLTAFKEKDKATIQYWSKRFVAAVRRKPIEEVMSID